MRFTSRKARRSKKEVDCSFYKNSNNKKVAAAAEQQQQDFDDMSKELTAIKAQLLIMASRLDHIIEKELKTRKND